MASVRGLWSSLAEFVASVVPLKSSSFSMTHQSAGAEVQWDGWAGSWTVCAPAVTRAPARRDRAGEGERKEMEVMREEQGGRC